MQKRYILAMLTSVVALAVNAQSFSNVHFCRNTRVFSASGSRIFLLKNSPSFSQKPIGWTVQNASLGKNSVAHFLYSTSMVKKN